MNKKVNLLLDEPCPELLCGICTDVLEDPVQVHCPEDHMFCSKCINSHVEYGQATCPICFTVLDKNSFQLSKFVARQIGRLRIQCCYADNGCIWQGLFSDNHITEELTCPNNILTCQPFLRRDISLHESQCASYQCPYATEGCPFIATLPQVNIHCEGYCGRIHKKVQDLELECKRLNSLIQDFTIGLNIKLPSTPEDIKQHDTSMDEMALFHQMLNSDPFGSLDLNTKPNDNNDHNTPMDINNLQDLSFLDSVFDTATSPQPLQFIPPVNVPKRTSHGKKIRYSKNVRLAHSALRMARQRTASNTTNPSNDAILNNLDIAKQKSQISFKNMDDVTEFLNASEPKKESKKETPLSPPTTSSTTTTTTTTTTSTSVPKRRPMFILASSYLSNYNTNNDKPL
ncbi:hypothetical protein INT48_009779 [Thamnidium elegans]|uniref:RING-type domain-containing protein n=1 Tax=Thamnidium elegans TaxID=101142 RepID=A0A8H7SMA7_9FUNG|nr:hypothetical protein INT48_009779 [Thamnidium elegans]